MIEKKNNTKKKKEEKKQKWNWLYLLHFLGKTLAPAAFAMI